MPKPRTRIVAAAIRFEGKVYTLPPPNRHHHILWKILAETGVEHADNKQGFLDESGRFLSRREALVSALLFKQVLNEDDVRAGRLFSEDLW